MENCERKKQMYKLSEKKLPAEFTDLFDESRYYRCLSDIYCNNGTFEKNSIVKIENTVVTRKYSDIEEDYICLHDAESSLQTNPPSLKDGKCDIPVGVTERNFQGLFEDIDEFNDTITSVTDTYASQKFVMNALDKARNVIFVLTCLAIGILMIFTLYEYLFISNEDDIKPYLKLFIPVSLPFVVCLAEVILSRILRKKFKREYESGLTDAYSDYQIYVNTENETE